MALYLVERYMPGLDVQATAAEFAERLRAASEGSRATWLGSIALPGDEACLCLFAAPAESDVRALNLSAGAAFDRILPALRLRARM